MEAKQVIFECPNSDTIERTLGMVGGIAIYENAELQGVICGCCGGFFEPHEITILRQKPWVNIADEIIGE